MGDIAIKKIVRHRDLETEIYYGIEQAKGYRATGHGNVQMKVNGESVSASIALFFARKLPGLHVPPTS